MRKVGSIAAAIVAAWTMSGCIPQPPAPSAVTLPASHAADMCERLGRVVTERAALDDAFELVIGNDVDAAVAQAHLVRSRLEALVDDLPVAAGVGQSRSAVRDAIEHWADIVDHAAAIIDGPRGALLDRDLVLAEGQVVLRVIDDVIRAREPGDPIAVACPGLELSVVPVSFPPPPTNAALGLPETVGDLVLEPHITSTSSLISEMLEAVGVDPTAVRQIDVHVTNGDGGVNLVEVVDRVEAPPAALAEAAREAILPEAKAATPEMISGFEVFEYRHPNEPTIAMHVAVRGDRIVIFQDLTGPLVRDILRAMT